MTAYLVTGATGFIGGQLVQRLLDRRGSTVHCLVREESADRLAERIREWGTTTRRVKPLVGDLTASNLGLDKATLDGLKGTVEHVIHLAAVYDITADAESQQRANVEGTRHVVQVANRIRPGGSTTCPRSPPPGGTRARSPRRCSTRRPDSTTRTWRPSTSPSGSPGPRRRCRGGSTARASWSGSSRTGEIDKIDGPYYVFKLIQRLRHMFPQWLPLVGLEGGRSRSCRSTTSSTRWTTSSTSTTTAGTARCLPPRRPRPALAGETMNLFADAAHAPQFQMRIDARASMLPKGTRRSSASLPPVANVPQGDPRRPRDPRGDPQFVNWPTTYDCSNTLEALEGTDIACPPLDDYAWRLWDHWERHLDPDLFRDRSLRGAIGEHVVLITGASDGIGKQVALDAAAAGAHVLLVSRTRDKLEAVQAEIEEAGGRRRCTRATCRTWTTSCGWPTRSSRSTAASTCWSTTRGGRSAGR
jgi:NAD(P)-dependent dehydrogenase (short-subunit alcohol dehydrogenase family)